MPSRFADPSGRGPSRTALVVRGTCYLAALALVVTMLVLQSQGQFRDIVRVTAVVGDVGDGLPSGSMVKMNGVQVGQIDTVVSEAGADEHRVNLALDPRHAERVPASVKARVLPSNVFGSPYVQLVPPDGGDKADATRATLSDGAVIQGDNSEEAVQLQTAITNTRDVLQAVHPAKLNVALTNMAQALDGTGDRVGSLIRRMDRYLAPFAPFNKTLGQNISRLADVLENLQRNAPALVDTVRSALVTSKTLVDKQQELAAALTGGSRVVGQGHQMLNELAPQAIEVTRGLRPVVDVLGEQSEQIPMSFQALGRGVDAFASAFDPETGGLRLDIEITATPYDPYTAKDCPVYHGVPGRNCGDPVPDWARQRDREAGDPEQASRPGSRADGAQSAARSASGGTVGPVGSDREKRKLDTILGKGGGDLAMLFGPIFRGTTVSGQR